MREYQIDCILHADSADERIHFYGIDARMFLHVVIFDMRLLVRSNGIREEEGSLFASTNVVFKSRGIAELTVIVSQKDGE